MEETTSPELAIFKSRLGTRRFYVAGGILILVLGSVCLGWIAERTSSTGSPTYDEATFRFITLLIIFMTALATTAAVFAGLRMGSGNEAFGLPSGSIRALLAIGIMILFVVFGLPLVSEGANEKPSIAQVSVPPEQLDGAVTLHRDQGFTVRVLDYGQPATRAARMEVTDRRSRMSSEVLDFNKQILTAVITLLTTVIGFYFGSRSTSDGMKEAEHQASNVATDDLAVARREIEQGLAMVKSRLLELGQQTDAAQAEPDPENQEQLKERQDAQTRVNLTRKLAEDLRDAVAAKLRGLEETMTALAGTNTGDLRKVHQRTAQDAAAGLKDLLAQAKAAEATFAADVERLLAATAKG